MADILYTHRISKLIEELVVGAGLTVHLSDEGSSAKLKPQVSAIKLIAESLSVELIERSENGATLISFRRKS